MTSDDKRVHRRHRHHRRDEDKRRSEDKRGLTQPQQTAAPPVSINHHGPTSGQQALGLYVFPMKLDRKSSAIQERRPDTRHPPPPTQASSPVVALPPRAPDVTHIILVTRKTNPMEKAKDGSNREHASRNHDRHRSREEGRAERRRGRDRGSGAQTDTELPLYVPRPPPPVLDELLQRREIPFRTPSGIDKTKLAIRFDMSKNPMDEETRIQLWDRAQGRYVDITLADWRKPVSPHQVVQEMILHMPHTFAQRAYLFKRDGLWLNDIFCSIYDLYDRVLTEEDLIEYASIIKTQSFQDWFEQRCKGLRNPDQARRLGYKHIDLLRGNVFFADVKHHSFERWIVRVARDPRNELRYGDAYDQ